MRRRNFISSLGSAAILLPLAARAQQSQLPVIGFLGGTSAEKYTFRLGAFRQGLQDAGYEEGRNVLIEYRWAAGDRSRLEALALELANRRVAVIAAADGTPSALAAQSATSTIPIVFETAVDPIQAGLVASLNRPGGNVTGVTNQNAAIGPKRLELLHELLPTAKSVAALVNPGNPFIAGQFEQGLAPAALSLGMRLQIVQASTEADVASVFAGFAQSRVDALVIAPDAFFNGIVEELAAWALRDGLPSIYQYRQFAAAGGLVSYGTSEIEYFRLFGAQVGKVLAGAKPADMPVEQAQKVELIINLKTAKALGVTVPLSLTGRADEVIE